MERVLELRTGESVAIRYELAGLGSRFLALAIDLGIQVLALVALVAIVAATTVPLASAVAATHLAPKTVGALALAAWVIVTFLIFFAYFIAFELWWEGRSPGKRLMGLRVVRDGGVPIDAGASTVRNVVRILETVLGFYLVSAVVALASPRNKRLGDYAAGTLVVRERGAAALDLDAYLERERRPDDGLDDADRDLVTRYLARRASLAADARRRLAQVIAARVRPKLRATFDHLDDEALLEHLGR